MKTTFKRRLKQRLNQRDKHKVFACDPKWENGTFWSGYSDAERQAILKQSQKNRKRGKIMCFAKYVDVTDFEQFYLTNHAFRAFVDKVRGAKGDFGCGRGAYKARRRK